MKALLYAAAFAVTIAMPLGAQADEPHRDPPPTCQVPSCPEQFSEPVKDPPPTCRNPSCPE